jgi:DNA-binding response OmpR family regulator
MAKILLVEDDQNTATTLKGCLELQNHNVEICHDGDEGFHLLSNYKYDLVILDWELPGLSGLEILKKLNKETRKTYILMLTGKTNIADREAGLDEGADDYLVKPFEPRELIARVRAVLRRASQTHGPVLIARDIELDPVTCRVVRDGEEIKLLPTEYALLEFFMRHPGEVFHVDAILEHVWKSDSEATNTAVRTYMTRLRKKIDLATRAPYIATVHGLGYRFDP